MTKKILCRADGNSKIGLGHLFRMLAIVEFYKENYEVKFVTKENSLNSVIPKELEKITIPKEITILEEPEWLSIHFSSKEYIIIADGYQFVSSYQKKIKETGFTMLYIDDLVSEHMYADVVINHSPCCMPEHYKSEKYTQFALGTNYAMLRPLFNRAAQMPRKINKITNAFICFGGADQYDLSIRAAKALLKIETIERIHIVLGGAYKHETIFLLQKDNDRLNLYKNLNEEALCKLMKSCQLAIAPSSTILYEICSVKMPVLSGFYVENQKNIYQGLAKKGVILKGGDFTNYTALDFEKKIKSLLNCNLIDSYVANQQQLFNGNSKVSFLGLMNSLNIAFRKVNKQDVLKVYNWSNDELVRKNSYHSEPIKLETHKIWFSKKIKNKQTFFLMALVNDKPAGIVRYEVGTNASIVGILVSKEYRGQKLASGFLRESAKLYFSKYNIPILAYIKKQNIPSLKAFENARYTYFKDEIIKGSISFVYKLEKQDVKG